MISHKIAPAIATGNARVGEAHGVTPLTALLLCDILYEAGLPPEMLSIVTGNPRSMGDAMITDPPRRPCDLHGLGQGRQVHRREGGLPPHRAGLGGNDPLIVCDDLSDADLDKAAELAVQGATKNSASAARR